MSSISDDDREENVFDQLKSIKAFTVDQLYLLHPDVGCPSTVQQPDVNDDVTLDTYHDQTLYQYLVEYEQLRQKLIELKASVKNLHRKTIERSERVWILEEESLRKIGMCQQDKIAETTLIFKKARLNRKDLNSLDVCFSELLETIKREYIYYSFESQVKRNRIITQLSISYQTQDTEIRRSRLKSSITTLVDFLKHLADTRSDFGLQCRRWLRALIKLYLDSAATDDYRFIIAQLCKGPAGTSDWSADLIECKPYEQVSNSFESTPKYISHCSALLTELFTRLKTKIRRVTFNSENSTPINTSNDSTDANWSLIDPRFSCSEELNINSSSSGATLSELDVIKLCLRIPVAQIFRAYVTKCLKSEEFQLETDKNYEFIMLKLLTIGTIIIKTYQIGLETFNSIQYGSLIEYLSSQIRRTVIVLSDQWTEFKRRLKGIDNALLMRLQVEYDNFMLRSILIILELRQCGIWRHLAKVDQDDIKSNDYSSSWSTDNLRPAFNKLLQVTGLSTPLASQPELTPTLPISSNASSSLTYEFSVEWFKEVSEPMLWHILWQFYHSAFTSYCDYHSDNYWLEKFQEKSVIYLFVNKIRDSSPSECSYLLNSITSMLLSRTRPDSKLVKFIATEIFNLSFKYPVLKDKTTRRGVQSLIRCAEKFPDLMSLYINYMFGEDIGDEAVDLIKGCSLTGWLCSDDEVSMIASWLIEYPLTSTHNKISRLLISKLLLNSSHVKDIGPSRSSPTSHSNDSHHKEINLQAQLERYPMNEHCFVNLKLRRHFALLLYEASNKHLPSEVDFGTQSLGTFVEVAFNDLFCERDCTTQENLLTLATDENFQQFYIWIWRIVFTLELHILNQPETDWNDVRTRSGTSRSVKNTVLYNDSFHPVPTLQDSECFLLSDGVKKDNALATYIYMTMTDITWQDDTLDSCLTYLNVMAGSGHLTPSLMAMKFLTICHLNDLNTVLTKDQNCIEYFRLIVTSGYDPARLASLIMTQLYCLKQYRQLQLSQFYITIFLEVAGMIMRQYSASWFSNNEHSLDKIASLLNNLVKFNFTTQRLEIIRRFYDCSYSAQYGSNATTSWLGSFFAANTLNSKSTRREFMTTLHALSQKFKKYTWLRWVTTECDTLRMEKIWEEIVVYLSCNDAANLDSAIKKVCPQLNQSILKSMLPIYSWIDQIFDIVETDLNHALCPLIWYNFFLNYFSNSLNGVAVGLKLVPQDTLNRLATRLDSLVNYHLYKHRNWTSASPISQNSLTRLYRAYRLWLQDTSLQNAYVDVDRLGEQYLAPLLKAVIESSTEGACIQFIDIQSIEMQNRNLCQIWSTATHLRGNQLVKKIIIVDSNQDDSLQILTTAQDEANDAISLIVNPVEPSPEDNRALANSEDEFKSFQDRLMLNDDESYKTLDEEVASIKDSFRAVFDESSSFSSNLGELDKIRLEVLDLIQQVYSNKKCEHIKLVACADGSSCTGPARIKFEVEEAIKDERKSDCISDRLRQSEELVDEILLLPTLRIVQSTILIEEKIKKLALDSGRAKASIEIFLNWINEQEVYLHLDGPYYAANHLFKILLDILSTSREVDTFNSCLMRVCCEHPGSVQIFSPHLSPSSCSVECFLDMYKLISLKQLDLGPTALFVLLSKFDINGWLKNIRSKEMHHDIIKTTCAALKQMGKQPDDSFNLTFELYKRHIYVELAPPDRRKFEELRLLLQQFLTTMDEQKLCPTLWLDFMEILGLERRTSLVNELSSNTQARMKVNLNKSLPLSSPSTRSLVSQNDLSANESFLQRDGLAETDDWVLSNIFHDITKLADSQMFLDYNSLNELVKTLSCFIEQRMTEKPNYILLERYRDYLDKFNLVMMSISFMWIRSLAENYPDNHDLIWKQFSCLWHPWILIKGNCLNVGKNSYNMIANQFVACLRYMLLKMSDNTKSILRSVLKDLTSYVSTTKEVVYLELTIYQRCLKNLPWASLSLSPEDIENLSILSDQENYNISDLVSHILQQVNLKESLTIIQQSDSQSNPVLAYSVERLATVIIIQSALLKAFRSPSAFLSFVQVDKIERLSSLVLARMEYANLEHSQTNKLLVNLMRSICIRYENNYNDSASKQSFLSVDTFNRSLIYAHFVSSYLVDLIKNHPSVVKYHRAYLHAVMDNSLQDLKILVSPDVEIGKKIAIYENLLECCSSRVIGEDSCLFLAESLIRSRLFRDRPIVVMEVFHSIGQIMSNARILVYTVERLIGLYLSMNGHYEKVWKSFSLKVLPSDLYLGACIEENTPLALLVYFEFLHRNGLEQTDSMTNSATSVAPSSDTDKIWSSFLHWIGQLTSTATSNNPVNEVRVQEISLVVVWLRLLDMLGPNLHHFVRYSRFHGVAQGIDVSASLELVGENEVDNISQTDLGKPEVVQATEQQQIGILAPGHRALIEFIKKLIDVYESSNSGGIWSYLKLSRGDPNASRIGLVALAVACFLSNRTLACFGGLYSKQSASSDTVAQQNAVTSSGDNLDQQQEKLVKKIAPHLSLLHDECDRLKRSCIAKLDVARRSKYHLDRAQFIETLIESSNRNDKVQYSEGVQLITTQVKSMYFSATDREEEVDSSGPTTASMMKILPSFNE